MSALYVVLVTPDRTVWSGEASIVIARTVSGEVGIMPGRQPLFGVLKPDEVTIRPADGAEPVTVTVADGFLCLGEDRLSILVTEVTEATEARERVKT